MENVIWEQGALKFGKGNREQQKIGKMEQGVRQMKKEQ